MAATLFTTSMFMVVISAGVKAQFFDIFSSFQPQNFQRDPYYPAITTTNPRPPYKQTNKYQYDIVNDNVRNDDRGYPKKPISYETTTKKPIRKVNNNRPVNKRPAVIDNNSKIGANDRFTNDYPRPNNDGNRRPFNGATSSPNNGADDKYGNDYNSRPNNGNRRPSNGNYDNERFDATKRPGVKPAIIDNGPPITNRPVTRSTRPSYRPETVRPRPVSKSTESPVNPGAWVFPEDDEGPPLTKGMDEDNMSDAEKRRYVEIAERMCQIYKASNTKKVQAIPLLPSPQPVQVNFSQCNPHNVPLIVGGKAVTIQDFPHMALLGWKKIDAYSAGYSWKCGGSLISDSFVLTAAHCAYQERDNTVMVGTPRAVQLGSAFLDDPSAQVVQVASVTRHPKYKLPSSYNDLALVKLTRQVSFSDKIRPACLGLPPEVGQSFIATGWGRTEFAGGDQSLELRAVSIPVWGMRECGEVLGTSRKIPQGPNPDSQICAGEKAGGKDTCQGDSGGPAQIQDGCQWRIVAVTSLGRSCGAPRTPALYAKVKIPFIAAHVFGRNLPHVPGGNKNTNNGGTFDNGVVNINNANPGSNSNIDSSNNGNNNYDYNNGGRNKFTTTTDSIWGSNRNYDSNNRGQKKFTTTTESIWGSGNRNYDNDNYGNNNRGQNPVTTTTDSSIWSNGNKNYESNNNNYDSNTRNNVNRGQHSFTTTTDYSRGNNNYDNSFNTFTPSTENPWSSGNRNYDVSNNGQHLNINGNKFSGGSESGNPWNSDSDNSNSNSYYNTRHGNSNNNPLGNFNNNNYDASNVYDRNTSVNNRDYYNQNNNYRRVDRSYYDNNRNQPWRS